MADICFLCKNVVNKNRVVTECGHIFHYNCIYKYNTNYTQCPECNNNFKYLPIKKSKSFNCKQLHFLTSNIGYKLICNECNKEITKCSDECTSIFCDCNFSNLYSGTERTNRNPIQSYNSLDKTCIYCFYNRMNEVINYLIQENITNVSDLVTLEKMPRFWNMYFRNTSGITNFENSYNYPCFAEYNDFLIYIVDYCKNYFSLRNLQRWINTN